ANLADAQWSFLQVFPVLSRPSLAGRRARTGREAPGLMGQRRLTQALAGFWCQYFALLLVAFAGGDPPRIWRARLARCRVRRRSRRRVGLTVLGRSHTTLHAAHLSGQSSILPGLCRPALHGLAGDRNAKPGPSGGIRRATVPPPRSRS